MHVTERNDPPTDRPAAGDATSPRSSTPPSGASPVAPGDADLPWKATAERRDLWGPVQAPLEGTVHTPTGSAVGRPRRRGAGRALLVGALAGVAVLAVGIGASLAAPALVVAAALGVGVVAGGGTAVVAQARRPARGEGIEQAPEPSDGPGRAVLEEVLTATAGSRERVRTLRATAPDPAAGPVLDRAGALLTRVEALSRSEELAARRPGDGGLALLEGTATRYLPELLDAAEDTTRFLATFEGSARQEALTNLRGIGEQLEVLGEGIEGVEHDVVAGVTRSLDVHAEFLRRRFADQHVTPLIDL